MVILVILMDLITAAFGFKEAWGFSGRGYEGIWSLFGKKNDHIPWVIERLLVLLLPIICFLLIGDLVQLSIVCLSWLLKFMAIHQYSYNLTMHKLRQRGYYMGIDESINTTAHKTSKYLKIALFVFGIIILFCYPSICFVCKEISTYISAHN